jgi:uncharacterized protein
MTPDLDDAELDALGDLLAAAPEPLEPLDVPALDGYLAGVLVQPRLVPTEEWLPPVFDVQHRALPADVDADWLARTLALIERRRAAMNASIAEDATFDPVLLDVEQLPPVSEYESEISRALAPWAAGFAWALACFPELERDADEQIVSALNRILRHVPAQDEAERAQRDAADREHPLKDADAATADLVAATVDLWDFTAKRRFAVATLRRDAPKVGRNDPCPCGSGRKFKACHGR